MSLEAAIKENTEVTRELIEVLTRTNLADVQGAAGKKPAKPTAADDADAKAGVKAGKGSITPAGPKPPAKAGKTDAYAPVKKAILDAIAAGHRKSITDMLDEYDAKTGQDLVPEVYEEVLEKIAVITGGELETELA